MTELWLVDLDRAAPALEAIECEVPRLAAADQERARRARDRAQQARLLAAHAALRLILERLAGPHIRRRQFTRSAAGKPSLGEDSPAFSLSHAGGLALVGVTRAGAVGVDLEAARDIRLSPHRRDEVLAVGAGLAGMDRQRLAGDAATLQAWCRLEAFAKARGSGISGLLGALGLRDRGGRSTPLAAIAAAAKALAREEQVLVADLRMPPRLHGAVAITEAARLALPLRPRRFPTERRAILRLLDTDT